MLQAMEKEGPQPQGAVAPDRSNCNFSHTHTQTLYMPIASPPTPAPSPGPDSLDISQFQALNINGETSVHDASGSNPSNRLQEIHSFLSTCTPSEILYISQSIAPLLKRDFLRCLPVELGLHILSFIDDPQALTRAALVSRWWNSLIMGRVNENGWRRMCLLWGFLLPGGVGNVVSGYDGSGASPSQTESTKSDADLGRDRRRKGRFKREEQAEEQPRECSENDSDPLSSLERFANLPMDPALEWIASKKRRELKDKGKGKAFPSPTSTSTTRRWSYKDHFIYSYKLMTNWRTGGQLLRAHRTPASSSASPDNVITSLALNNEWVIVGLANSRIHVFSGRTGVLARTLVGHESGVWAVCLIAANGSEAQSEFMVPDSDDHAPPPPPRNHHSWDNLSGIEGTRNLAMTLNPRGRRGRKQRLFIAPFDEEEEQEHPQEVQYVPPAMRVALGLELDEFGEDGEDDDEVSDEDVQTPVEEPSGTTFTSRINGAHMDTGKPSEPSGCSEGWGQPNAIVVSGGCDKTLRVWDVLSGYCIYVLRGHTSTIRCIKVLHNRPIAITGSRDTSLRVWDVKRGKLLRVLRGHSNSVRCLDVCGNKVVSGSYDCSLKLWNVDNGECLHTFTGHFSQVYSVAFDGVRIVSGGLDTTVRVWDPIEGQCLALLQGHAALVCQVQLSPYSHLTPTAILVTGGSDGRVITYTLPHPRSFDHSSSFSSISTFTLEHKRFGDDANNSHPSISSADPEPQYCIQHRLMAHDSSVTALQFDKRWLLTGGNDGRVKLWDVKTGLLVRELGGASKPSSKRSNSTGRINSSSRIAILEDDGNASSGSRSPGAAECVWKAGFSKGGEVCVIMVKHAGKSVMEIWSMRPEEELCSTD
ncbi:hypothetical protein E1B28_013245 [Marasmius oreades]|uniref:F-box domain-containing protein n=1 Tax=Marasmius oreades TaxID=181124 RepID=A0A9P7RP76_9AGAR|nr:uncharacterized protein E1B28_013245 [Marasmius oreades]KAG7087266.1 hypothetical protein E1B28_013245 [Marasmius oreades]